MAVHGPVFSRRGRYGRYDSFSLDANHSPPFQLAADGGLVPADQPGRFPDAQTLLAMQPLDPDPLVRGQVRITCTHECNTSSWNLDTSNPRQVLHFYLEPADSRVPTPAAFRLR